MRTVSCHETHHCCVRVQAQTLANFYLAFELDLTIVPVLNKIDLPAADPARTAADVQAAFDMPEESCIHASAKTGLGIENVLKAVVERVPPPQVSCHIYFWLLSLVPYWISLLSNAQFWQGSYSPENDT